VLCSLKRVNEFHLELKYTASHESYLDRRFGQALYIPWPPFQLFQQNQSVIENKSILNVIHYTTIMKQVKQLTLTMLDDKDVCVCVVFVWRKFGGPGGNSPVRLGDHITISHATPDNRSLVVAVRGERFTTATAREPD